VHHLPPPAAISRPRPGGGRVTAVSALALLLALLLPGTASPAAADACDGVWVVVDARELGGSVTTRCAPGDPGDGVQALESAGHRVDYVPGQPGFICQLDQRPNPCPGVPPEDAYWSYWHAEPGGSWVYSGRGGLNRDPAVGTADGWRFGDGSQPPPAPPAPAPTGGSGGDEAAGGSEGDSAGDGSGGSADGGSSNGGSNSGSNGGGSNGGSNSGSNGGGSNGDRPDGGSADGDGAGGSSDDGGPDGDGPEGDDPDGDSPDRDGSDVGGSSSDDPAAGGAPGGEEASDDADPNEAQGPSDGSDEVGASGRSAASRGSRDASIPEDGELVPDPDGTETVGGQADGAGDDDQTVTLADAPRGGAGSWASLGVGATLALGLAAGAMVQVRRRRALSDVT
jgi:hypothetical protein